MIKLQKISKSIVTKTLFEDVTFSLDQKLKVGLVGPNGCGKTTLLKIILQEEDPDEGQVFINNETIGYLPQEIQVAYKVTITDFFRSNQKIGDHPYNISKILQRVNLEYLDPATLIKNLSGGEKMRVGLARILLIKPTTLLLDEPTNNLDLSSLAWLEDFVSNFAGKVLIISHDRYFLDKCIEKIIEIDPFEKQIQEYGGGYTSYLEQKASRQDNLFTQYKLQQLKEKQMKEWIANKQQQLKYHPNPKVASQLKSMKTRLNREVEENRINRPKDYQSFSINNFANNLPTQKSILSVRNLFLPGLFECDQLDIFGGDRILLTGANGSGKTTLIRNILEIDHDYQGSIEPGAKIDFGYFSQGHDIFRPESTVLAEFMRFIPDINESRARSLLGSFLFPDRTVFKNINSLSLGERARLHLAVIINQNNNFLILDEPTNHLDLPSREMLEKALKQYQGGFIVVSHDRYFVRQIGINRVLKIDNHRLI